MKRIGAGFTLLLALAACQGSLGGDDEGASPDDPSTLAVQVPEPLAARLTDFQYRYTVEDVLGVTLDVDEIAKLPRDIPIEAHYSTDAEGQIFDQQFVIAYAEISRTVTSRLDIPALVQEHGDCAEETAACRDAFITGLGLRLFRRPLTPGEIALYGQLADDVATFEEGTFDDGIAAVTQAMMQAPPFVYRLEDETAGVPDAVRWVSGYELASRLSFFLWQSAPDPELLAFAATVPAGGEPDATALAAQVDRMMADPRYARARELFWADYTLLSTASFPFVEPAIATEMRESLMATLNGVSGVGGVARPVADIFTLDTVQMTPAVAEIAGASTVKDGLAPYASSELEERIGITTHPGFLGAVGTTSFVGRGLFMSRRFLCLSIAPPPSDENAFNRIQETAQETEELTPREASLFRFNLEPACQGCHQIFEPIAYAYERYDIEGRYGPTDEEGRELFSDGVLPAGKARPEIAFDDVTQLMTELATTEDVARCLVQNMLEYATMHPARHAQSAIASAYAAYETDGTFDGLVRAVALDPQLRRQHVVAPAPGE